MEFLLQLCNKNHLNSAFRTPHSELNLSLKDKFQRFHYSVSAAFIGKTALKEGKIRLTHRTVGRKLDGASLHKGTCRHNDLVAVARHFPGHGSNVGINRRACLDSLTEFYQHVGVT